MNTHAVTQAIENVRAKSFGNSEGTEHSVTINFHPDRYTPDNVPLLLAIAKTGELRSQFETATSNGGLTAYNGGARWLWEQRIFGGAYDKAPLHLRPKYGALNFRKYKTGAAPRFGSAFFQLKSHVLERTTFCYPDSFFEPEDCAVSNTVSSLIAKASLDQVDLLDDYIEAHIHGVVSIKTDVECLVLDPIYRFSVVEEHAHQLGITINWHDGYELQVNVMSRYPSYRGKQFIQLARSLAVNGTVNARLLGTAITEQGYDEQEIKKIWHYLARYGYLSARA
ncbi:DUF3626 domain-containing protein [Endozoicomonas elysicola]|uniref:DUF3626 domain-containing protein n=1 Tax=Endozoicomonas elysicola TaxID=305900 RepID=A0A081KB28_9GAMM|nr:DUF3626 domain-containing protein [Endozoicomonas elysicola]KEI71354.1 hypothetical protein GV64_11920 [Endozoicomonas elysicola]